LEEFLDDVLNAEFDLVRDADNDGSDVSLVSVSVVLSLSPSLFSAPTGVNICCCI